MRLLQVFEPFEAFRSWAPRGCPPNSLIVGLRFAGAVIMTVMVVMDGSCVDRAEEKCRICLRLRC